MGAHRNGSKGGGGGGYVGGFLHLFDWNAKSRKKLFSSKSESPEQPKQTKRTNGNMPVTRFNTMDEVEMIGGTSLKGSSDYSCATSITDEDGYGTKAPGVVARLMGLDSLPTFNFSDTISIPSFDSQSHREFESNDYKMEIDCSVSLAEPPKMVIGTVLEKFRTETLPPKSVKSIPITRHKLLSPIKNSGFVSSSSPAHIMEAASKIPLVGSSSFKEKVSREKIESSSKKPKIAEAPRSAAKNVKKQQTLEPKKSISLALQAKENVQKREGLNHRVQSVRTQPNGERNPRKSTTVSSNVLKQNNQKQNSLVDRGKSTPKSAGSTVVGPQTRKPVLNKSSSKITENSRTSHKTEPYSVTRRKRSMEDIKNKNVVRDKSYKNDVISFTFTAPIARPNTFLTDNQNKNVLDSAIIRGDALSNLLEQKLRELTNNTESASQDLLVATESDVRDDSSYGFSSYDPLERKHHKRDQDRDRIGIDDSSFGFSTIDQGQESSIDDYEYRKFLRGRQPSPSSVLEPSFITESCNSSDTAESCRPNSTSVQGQEIIATSFSSPMDIDAELLDSASSITSITSITTVTKWEPDYVKDILSDIETMFVDFTIGKTRKIVNPRVFDRLELGRPSQDSVKLRRELVFGCVTECVETRCRVWAKGLAVVRRPDRLADDVYKEIAGWEEMKDGMVDELVDKDMSGDGYKKWLDFDVEALELGVEIESRLIDSLIDEVVDDILVL